MKDVSTACVIAKELFYFRKIYDNNNNVQLTIYLFFIAYNINLFFRKFIVNL